MKAIQLSSRGGPEVLEYVDVPDPRPGKGQALIDLKAIGVNYRDVYSRSSTNQTALAIGEEAEKFPAIPGVEGAGTVLQVGEGVSEVAVGDLITYYYDHTPDPVDAPTLSGIRDFRSSYAEKVLVPSWRLVKVPEGVDAETAAAVIVQGMTAHFLCYSAYPVKSGDAVLIHAAAGGTGHLLVQMVKQLGARVFATTSTEEKARIAKEAGAEHVIIYTQQDFEQEIKKLAGPAGINVVYDSVGADTFDKGLACLAPRGYMVLYGHASGPVPPVATAVINRGSLFLTRPRLGDYTATRQELLWRAGDVLEWVRSGKLKVLIHDKFHLEDAAEAHRRLESRQSVGKLLLIP